jgi:hypothetical protein
LRHVKKPLLEQNFSLIKVNFGRFFHGENFAQIIGQFFLEKISPNAIKNCPNGKISPNLVTLGAMVLDRTTLDRLPKYLIHTRPHYQIL